MIKVKYIIKGGILIEGKNNKIENIKKLVEGDNKEIFRQLLVDILKLDIKQIQYEENIKMRDISEYEFELVKIKATISEEQELEIYLKLIKNSRIKESIFCYWCTIYEDEVSKIKDQLSGAIINKVMITELNKKKYQQSIFLEIENNKTPILETGTEIIFFEIVDYINQYKTEKNEYEKIFENIDEYSNDVLLIGIKMTKDKKSE